MNPADLGVAVVAGVVGFGIIWGIFALIRQQKAPPIELFKTEPRPSAESGGKLSLEELGRTWHIILGVPAQARPDEIEAGYHARLAECDRIREKQDAETRRAQVNEAYEFIRQARQ